MNDRAGSTAQQSDLIDIAELVEAYHRRVPDPAAAAQRVVFGTSGHRGSSLDTAFNDAHVAAITQAVCEYRAQQGVTGPVFVGRDTHALSAPAVATALQVLAGNGVRALVDSRDGFVPTPALSHAIIGYNASLRASADAAASRAAAHSTSAAPDAAAADIALDGLADGLVMTPSHNPPRDGGIKYNPPHGGPADSDATDWIAVRANQLLANGNRDVQRAARGEVDTYDYLGGYVEDLRHVIDIDAIRRSGIRIGADPLGGASVRYWQRIAHQLQLDIEVVNPEVDPAWAFMTLDWDGKIRMDPSSPHAMASVLAHRDRFDLVTGNDADADRHGIVTPDGGLMNPNHFLAVAIDYLCEHRPDWPKDAAIGKTLVSSAMIDRVVAAHGRRLFEVPVGFKWFVPGLTDGSVVFGGEESAGASFVRFDGGVWSTDKDGILLALLAAEIRAVTGKSPSQRYAELTERFGAPAYQRTDAAASREQKQRLGRLTPDAITATTLAGDPITARLSTAPGNGAPIGGVKVMSERAWFAARPSGTEDVYKIYAESFAGEEHLALVQAEAKAIVDRALAD